MCASSMWYLLIAICFGYVHESTLIQGPESNMAHNHLHNY